MTNPIIQLIEQHLIQNSQAYITAAISTGSLLFLAVVNTMPALVPKSFQDVWTWIRSTLQTATPINRFHPPTVPVDPPNTNPVGNHFPEDK